MKTRLCALPALLCALPALLLVAASAQPTQYIVVNGTFSPKPDVSTVQKPITFIRWKKGNNLVVDWIDSGDPEYFGIYKNRTHLNIQTLHLEILRLTVADSGTFSLETEKGTVEKYLVQVIRRPPTPRLRFKPLVCHQDQPCAVMCDVETLNLGPITFYWRRNDGEWRRDVDQVTLSRPEEPETITCKLTTPLGDSESSPPRYNPLYKPPTTPTPPTPSTSTPPWVIGLIVFILIAVAAGVGVYLLVKCCPDHPVSKKLTSWLPSETNVGIPPPNESPQGVSPEGSALLSPPAGPDHPVSRNLRFWLSRNKNPVPTTAEAGAAPPPAEAGAAPPPAEAETKVDIPPPNESPQGVSPEETLLLSPPAAGAAPPPAEAETNVDIPPPNESPQGAPPEVSAQPVVSPEGSAVPGASEEATPLLPSPAGAAPPPAEAETIVDAPPPNESPQGASPEGSSRLPPPAGAADGT